MSSALTPLIQQVDDLAEQRIALNKRILILERALREIVGDPFEHAFRAPEKVRRYKDIARQALDDEPNWPRSSSRDKDYGSGDHGLSTRTP